MIEIKKILKNYYADMKESVFLKYRKEQLIAENTRLEEKAKGIQIDFHVIVRSASYENTKVSGGDIQNDYERQIDNFYNEIDRKICKNKNLIINIENQLFEIEEKSYNVTIALNLLEDELVKILEMTYQKGYSQDKIAFEMSMSRGTVQYKLKKHIKT